MSLATPKRPAYTGFLSGFLETSAHAEELHQHLRRQRALKRCPKPATLDALWQGAYSLEKEAAKDAEHLRDRGQLLFAHAGTTYFQQRPHISATTAWAPSPTKQGEEVPA